ncbi:hypothetical protein GEMRC1_014000 [Eukaryota sp. GEM-RC1]
MIRKLRRIGLLNPFLSVYVNSKHETVYLACDGGRVCRPLLIVENGKRLLTDEMIDELKHSSRDFESLIHDGVLEYVDVNEHNDCFIALNEQAITHHTTHLEIHPLTVLGVVAGLIPFPHHNQSPRNTYQCAMGKQALGAVAYNQLKRIDTILYLLVYPQRPMAQTKQIQLLNLDKLPAGQNAMVAVMSYSGYDIEDALILNRASIDRGYGRCIVLKKETTSLRKYPSGISDSIAGPPPDVDSDPRTKRFRHLDGDGIAPPGSKLTSGDVYLNKCVPTSNDLFRIGDKEPVALKQTPLAHRGPADVIVDQTVVTMNEYNEHTIKFSMRQTRIPEIGDKFSSRHGQRELLVLL